MLKRCIPMCFKNQRRIKKRITIKIIFIATYWTCQIILYTCIRKYSNSKILKSKIELNKRRDKSQTTKTRYTFTNWNSDKVNKQMGTPQSRTDIATTIMILQSILKICNKCENPQIILSQVYVNNDKHTCINLKCKICISTIEYFTQLEKKNIPFSESLKAAFHPCVNVYIYKPINRSEWRVMSLGLSNLKQNLSTIRKK